MQRDGSHTLSQAAVGVQTHVTMACNWPLPSCAALQPTACPRSLAMQLQLASNRVEQWQGWTTEEADEQVRCGIMIQSPLLLVVA